MMFKLVMNDLKFT